MSFFIEDGNIIVQEAGRTALNTAAPMMNLIPSETITLNNYDIEFPNLWYGLGYIQARQTEIFGDVHSCSSFSALVEQEWGPSQSSPNNLPEIILGTVPVGTDYLDVRINLSRIVSPSNILNMPFYPAFTENSWVKLEGGSCIAEKQSGISRLFEIVLSGTNVILRRYQSVRAGGGFTRNNPSASSGNQSFFYSGTNAPNDASRTSIFGTFLDNKASLNAPTHRPSGKEAGSSNNSPCNMSTSSVNYRSVYRGTIVITPGRISG